MVKGPAIVHTQDDATEVLETYRQTYSWSRPAVIIGELLLAGRKFWRFFMPEQLVPLILVDTGQIIEEREFKAFGK